MNTENTLKTKTVKPRAKPTHEYIEGIGRRKTAIARVRAIESSKNTFLINEKPLEEYFKTPELRSIVNAPLTHEGIAEKYTVTVHVKGGGIHAQAEAVRHGLSRIIVGENQTLKKDLKKLGFLKRDSRKKERKHFGLKKARKASQWSKR